MKFQRSKPLYFKEHHLSTLVASISLTTFIAIPAAAATIITSGAVILSNPVTTPMWNAGADTYIGSGGTGTLTASQGTIITGTNFYIGQNSGDTGTLNLFDSGTILTSDGLTTIGESGNGTLNIFNAVLTNNWNKPTSPGSVSYSVNIGNLAGSQGIVNIAGTGSALNVTGTGAYSGIGVGLYGSGMLKINQGGVVSSPRVRVGFASAAEGTVVVGGAGSKLSITNPNQWMIVGVNGTGNLIVSNQGQLDNAGYFRIAEGNNGGTSGTGNVQVLSGGTVNVNQFTDIAYFQNTNGQLRVSDVGSTFTSNGRIIVGRQGNGTLTTSNYGTIRSGQGIIVGSNILGTGNINIGEGEIAGVLDVPTVTGGPGSTNINFNHIDDIDFSPQMLGTLNLTKNGSGTTTLMANNTYSGRTTVSQGNLQAGAEDVFSPNSSHLVESGGQLDLNGFNQKIASLTNGGIVKIAGSSAGTILNVTGDYVGNNGLLIFNTVLGEDNSVTDRLIIGGNTAGNTQVTVNNLGGSGAKTLNGIELISVGGDSDGNFIQTGRLAAGAFDYKLQRGVGENNKNWYLISDISSLDPGNPGNPGNPENPENPENPGNPENPENPPVIQVVRPEVGAYSANFVGARNMFTTDISDRLGETEYTDTMTGERKLTSLWIKNTGGHTRSHDNSGQLHTQSNRYALMLGGDIADGYTSDGGAWRLGALGGYGYHHSKTRSNVTNYHAKGEVEGYTAGLYGVWYASGTDEKGYYADAVINYNWFNNTVDGQDIASEKYRSRGLSASFENGYVFQTSSSPRLNSYIQPKLKVSWSGIDMDDHREHNGTRVSAVGENNVKTSLGVRAFLKGHNKIDDGKQRNFKPFIEANWIHNTEDYGTSMNGVQGNQVGTRNLGELKLGVEGRITEQFNLTGYFAQQIGNKGYSDSGAMIGAKYSF